VLYALTFEAHQHRTVEVEALSLDEAIGGSRPIDDPDEYEDDERDWRFVRATVDGQAVTEPPTQHDQALSDLDEVTAELERVRRQLADARKLLEAARQFTYDGPGGLAIVTQQEDGTWWVFHPKAGPAGWGICPDRASGVAFALALSLAVG